MHHMQQFFLYTVFTDVNRTNSTWTSQTDKHVVLCVRVFFFVDLMQCGEGGFPAAAAGLEKGSNI